MSQGSGHTGCVVEAAGNSLPHLKPRMVVSPGPCHSSPMGSGTVLSQRQQEAAPLVAGGPQVITHPGGTFLSLSGGLTPVPSCSGHSFLRCGWLRSPGKRRMALGLVTCKCQGAYPLSVSLSLEFTPSSRVS